MRDDEPDINVAEEQASRAEGQLVEAITESEADAAEVAYTLRELRTRLDEEIARGAVGLDELAAELARTVTPIVPMERHRERVREARADAVRARMWVVTAMRDDLKRFGFELGDAVRTADRVRDTLQRIKDERFHMTRRFDRIRTSTAEMVAVRDAKSPAARRQLPRIRIDAKIDLHSESNFFAGFSENISDGGVFVATDQQVPIGTEVDLAFTLPDGVEIRGRGAVRWVRDASPDAAPGLGVQFVNLSGAAHDAVQNFVRLRSPLFLPDS